MLSASAMLVVALTVIVLLVSGWWTDRTYQRFDQIPGHYDLRGEATRLSPRRQMAWLLPVVFSIALAIIVALMHLLPRELQNGDPSQGIWLISLILLVAQAMVLWLLRRWASTQPPNP